MRLTAAVWRPEALSDMLPKRKASLAEKRSARDAEMARRVHEINSVMRLRKGRASG